MIDDTQTIQDLADAADVLSTEANVLSRFITQDLKVRLGRDELVSSSGGQVPHRVEIAIILRQNFIARQATIRKKTRRQWWIGNVMHHNIGHCSNDFLGFCWG